MLFEEMRCERDMAGPAAKRFKYSENDSSSDRNASNSNNSTEEFKGFNEKKGKSIRNPTSHRIIEKRRRDRMNNCLADLNKLMPTHYMKQGQGRTEKTEIIEMAIKLIKNLQNDKEKKESVKSQDPMCLTPLGENSKPCCISKFYMGFKECQDEVIRFLVETEDNNTSDQVCVCMMEYLGKAAKKFLPTQGRDTGDSDYTSSYQTGMRSRGSSGSLSPSSADMMEKNMQMLSKNKDVNSDSGFTNTGSTFSSMSLPLGKCQTEGMQFNSRTTLDVFTNYERSNTSSCSGQGTYKFKDNITKRFSLQKQKLQQSDTSSSSSQEEQNLDMSRRRILKTMVSDYSQETTPYPSSSDDGYNRSVQNDVKVSASGQESQVPNSNLSSFLPGFVLHPSGSHYFPISMHSAHVPKSFLSNGEDSSAVFHPVSIPVRFCGPCVPMGQENIKNSA